VKLLPLAILPVAALYAVPASAQKGYVALTNSTLGVTVQTAEPPDGCQLCHTDPAGGTVSLRPFGQMMVSRYGLISSAVETAGTDASLLSALQALKTDQPALVQDLQKGVDPNPDVVSDPVWQSGCTSARGRSVGAAIVAVGFGLFALSAVRRGRRRAR
jgi:hypothetical protein